MLNQWFRTINKWVKFNNTVTVNAQTNCYFTFKLCVECSLISMLRSSNSQGIYTYYVKNNILHNTYTPNFFCEKNKLLYISHIPKVCGNYKWQKYVTKVLSDKSKGKDSVPSEAKSLSCASYHICSDITLMNTDNDFDRKLWTVHHLTDTFICIQLNENTLMNAMKFNKHTYELIWNLLFVLHPSCHI